MATVAGSFDRALIGDDRRDFGPLFVATIFVGSFLLFLVQPMVARMALPRLGGAPAVWNSAMLVYQALLLGGYAYAHAIGRFGVRTQAFIHLALFVVAAAWLPLGLIDAAPSADASPALWVPWLLTLSIGPLFFAVAAQAPLIQRWYAAASGGRDPYALYAASNFGSFSGLLAYPLLVEPQLALAGQSAMWTTGYVLLGLLVAACALALPRAGVEHAHTAVLDEAPPSLKQRAYWVLLAFVPSGLMLSTTTYLTTDIVAMPMLWVVPLGLYLLSFTVAFASRQRFALLVAKFSPLIILTMGGLTIQANPSRPAFTAIVGLSLLFLVGVTLHGEMYRSRPAAERLTGFYLCMSIGGALGGVFAALVAPLLFDWSYEHPILIFLAGMLAPQAFLAPALGRLWRDHARLLTIAVIVVVAALAVLAIDRPGLWLYEHGPTFGALSIGAVALFCIGRRLPYLIGLAGVMLVFGGWDALQLSMTPRARTRSYFGIYTIRDYPARHMRTLAHGTTFHGMEILDRDRLYEPTSYYGPRSGIGQALIALPALAGPSARVGIVGLGAGTLACYAKRGQSWRFFEIDRAVVRIARDSGSFSFLPGCLPGVPIVIGDARLSIAAAQPASLDLLALDAFSSDVVPMHLLTREAFEGYGRVLSRRGLLLVHISNRFLDLEPVIAAAARDARWTAAVMTDTVDDKLPGNAYVTTSTWVALSRDRDRIGKLVARDATGEPWRPLMPRPGFAGWTDDFSSILPLVNAFHGSR